MNDKKCYAIEIGEYNNEISLQQFMRYTPLSFTFLGAHLKHGAAMNDCLRNQCIDFERAISRLNLITAHNGLVLLRASYSAPSLKHILRTSPCNGHINDFDYSYMGFR